MLSIFVNGKLLLLLTVNVFIKGKLLLSAVNHSINGNNFINDKEYSLTALYKDDIAVYTCDHSFLNFLRYIPQSSRIKQT